MRRCFLLALFAALANAATYYASPTGSIAGDGSLSASWDLQSALNRSLAPGDTLYLLGGTYVGSFSSTLGAVTITHAPGQWAKIDGWISLNGPGGTTLDGIEICNSNTNRLVSSADGIYAGAPNLRILNNIIHDVHGDGIGFWSSAPNSIAFGNVIYYNGYNDVDRGHGHGIYVQSYPGDTKLIEKNVILNQFGWGLHAYTEGGNIDGITFRGNIVANSGKLASVPCSQGGNNNLLTGGYVVAQSPVWDSNYSYGPGCVNANLGYNAGTNNARLFNNWFVGSMPLTVIAATGLVETGSVSIDTDKGKGKRTIPVSCFVRPNGIVAVYNLSGTASSSSCDVTSMGVADGAQIAVVSAEDYFHAPLILTVTSQHVSIPLNGWNVAAPVGWPAPASMLPKFGAFVLRAQ